MLSNKLSFSWLIFCISFISSIRLSTYSTVFFSCIHFLFFLSVFFFRLKCFDESVRNFFLIFQFVKQFLCCIQFFFIFRHLLLEPLWYITISISSWYSFIIIDFRLLFKYFKLFTSYFKFFSCLVCKASLSFYLRSFSSSSFVSILISY